MTNHDYNQPYRDFVREANGEPLDDEYAALAAQDALSGAYGLNRYPAPPSRKKGKHAEPAAHTGGFFAPDETTEAPCRG